MTPAQLHIHLHVLFTAGLPPTNTVGDPGAQGAEITGVQGIGVNTPPAAAVAADTCGFAIDVHIPNGMMFVIGTLSMIHAAGILLHMTLAFGRTLSTDGAIPKLHISCAPEVTIIDTFNLLPFCFYSQEVVPLPRVCFLHRFQQGWRKPPEYPLPNGRFCTAKYPI